MIEVDARGLSCPEPVMLTNRAYTANPNEKIKVLVDDACARANVEKFGKSKSKTVTCTQSGGDYVIEIG